MRDVIPTLDDTLMSTSGGQEGDTQVTAIADIWQFWMDQAMTVTLILPPSGVDISAFPCGDSIIGKNFLNAVGVELNVSSTMEFNNEFRAQARMRNVRFVCQRAHNDGQRIVLVNGMPIWKTNGDFDGYRCTATDISSAGNAGTDLHDYEAVLGAFIRHVPNLVVMKDIEGRYMAVNPLAERTYGLPGGKLIGKQATEVLPSSIFSECLKSDEAVLEFETVQEVEQRFAAPDGERVFHTVKFPVFDADRYLVGIGAIGVDITEYKKTEDGLYKRANFDSVTGLPNRHLMMDRLDQAVAAAQRLETMVGVIVLDMGDFTGLNEVMGRIAADWLLIEVGATLRTLCRQTDTVCRLDGDVFAIVASNLKSPEELDLVAAKILKTLQEPRLLGEEEVFIQPSIGAALSSDANTTKDLVHCAQMALDMAKESGRGRVVRYKKAISGAFVRRMKLESQLRHAVERNELSLVYQPIVDVKTKEIVSAEALLRWHNPDLGFVSPVEFIPVAEETGLIGDIGAWVMRQACADAKRMNPAGAKPLVVAVNVSVKQLSDAGIVAMVEKAMKDADLDPALLKIEMTESAFADDKQTFQAAVEGFRNLGSAVALDDFGTGYSSLSYLHRYRFSQLKIDKSFIDSIAARGDGYLLVENIIRMAHSLRLDVVAEGVETDEQIELLQDLKCNKFQGYRVSKPIPLADFEKFVAQHAEALQMSTLL